MQKIILFKFKIYILSKHLNVLRNLTIQITEYQEVHNNMKYTYIIIFIKYDIYNCPLTKKLFI